MSATLKRYRVSYRDDSDMGCPTFSCIVSAYDKRHAEEKFIESGKSDGWEIVSVVLMKSE